MEITPKVLFGWPSGEDDLAPLSPDGRYSAVAEDLTGLDNSLEGVELFDNETGRSTVVSFAASGYANAGSAYASFSGDGSTLFFASEATNLDANASPNYPSDDALTQGYRTDVSSAVASGSGIFGSLYSYNIATGVLTLIQPKLGPNVAAAVVESSASSFNGDVIAYQLAFEIDGGQGFGNDIDVYNATTGKTTVIDIPAPPHVPAIPESLDLTAPSISADGGTVAFTADGTVYLDAVPANAVTAILRNPLI
jgi:hypothetical protein